MKHPSSRDLYAYWSERRGRQAAPQRAAIEPAAIRHLLGDSFMLALDRHRGHPFRLAGTRICALFCRELKEESFVSLWVPASRGLIDQIIAVLAEESVSFVAGLNTQNTAGEPLALELLLLPLAAGRPGQGRAIGILAPYQPPAWLGERPLCGLTLGSYRHLGATPEKRAPMLPVLHRTMRRFVVYQGGRAERDPAPLPIVPPQG